MTASPRAARWRRYGTWFTGVDSSGPPRPWRKTTTAFGSRPFRRYTQAVSAPLPSLRSTTGWLAGVGAVLVGAEVCEPQPAAIAASTAAPAASLTGRARPAARRGRSDG